jgi:hypothetical protein
VFLFFCVLFFTFLCLQYCKCAHDQTGNKRKFEEMSAFLGRTTRNLQKCFDDKGDPPTTKTNYLYSLWPFGPLPREFEESKLLEYLDGFRNFGDCTQEELNAFDVVEAYGRKHFDTFKYIDSTTLSHKVGMTDANELKTTIQRYWSLILLLYEMCLFLINNIYSPLFISVGRLLSIHFIFLGSVLGRMRKNILNSMSRN